MDPEALRAAIGRNATHYLAHFERMQRSGRTWLPGWNSAAFLHSTGWFWYRRMYGWALLNLAAPVLLLLLLVFVVRWLVPADEGMDAVAAYAFVAYLVLVFLVLPVFADSLYLRGLLRARAPKPPSAWTALGTLLIVALPGGLAYVAAAAQIEYQQRARVTEGVAAAASLKAPIAEFYAERRRLPGPAEAAQFRYAEKLQHTAAVGWDPARRSIVATMGERFGGRSFEFAAQEKDGALEWTCRPIDLEPKLLPLSCRPSEPAAR